MVQWVRGARWGVAVAGAGFLVVVFLNLGERERPVAPPPIVPVDPEAEMEVVGATSRQWSGTDERFTVRSDRQFGYQDGRIRYEGVTVYVDDLEGNREFVATARTGDVNGSGDRVTLTGDVRMVSSDGLEIEADEATYDTGDRVVRAGGPVAFSLGRLSGTGVGMTYDRGDGLLHLEAEAEVSLAPDEEGLGSLEATADAASLARREHYVRFEGHVLMLRDGREIRADNAVGYLTEDETSLTGLDLRGNSRIDSQEASVGAMKAMLARDINLEYAPDGQRIERATLANDGAIEIAGDTTEAGRRISANLLDVQLGEDGATVTSLTGRGRVALEFPAEGDAPARTIRADSMEATGGPSGGLASALLGGAVEYREQATSVSEARLVESGVLDLGLRPGLAGITAARFSEAVRFEQGETGANAETANYILDAGTIELAGKVGGDRPTVEDPGIWIEADGIVLTVAGPKVAARGSVESRLNTDQEGGADREAARVPGFLASDEPVNVRADVLDYDGTAGLAAYTGSGRLWQGGSAVQGTTIVIDTTAGNLTAMGGVRSTLFVRQQRTEAAPDGRDVAETTDGPVVAAEGPGGADDPAGESELEPVIGLAEAFDYDEAARRLTYTTRARVNGPQGDLVADRVELFLIGDTNNLERIEAYDAVTLREAIRTATGARMTYFSDTGRYDMSGSPVRVLEGCRESTGRTLTFYKALDEILIDGQQSTRTRTRNEGQCDDSQASNGASAGAGR